MAGPDATGVTPAAPLWSLAGRAQSDEAATDSRRSSTWQELEERTNALGHGLLRNGARPGEHVILLATNHLEFLEAFLGAQRAGFVITPLKSGWTPTEIAAVARDAGTVAILSDLENGRAAAEQLALPLVDLDPARGFDDWLDRQPRASHPAAMTGRKMSYTSGTTGRPKGVVTGRAGTQTFSEAFLAGRAHAERLKLSGDGPHLITSQMFHGAPTTWAMGALARGAPLHIMERWDPEEGLARLQDRVLSTVMVPTMFRQLLALSHNSRRRFDGGALTAVVHGGEPCPTELKRRMIEWFGPIVHEYFGFTEGGLTVCLADEWLQRPGTVGRAVGGEIRILDENGTELPTGTEGAVYFAPSGKGFRYFGDERKTSDAYVDGAFTAGDIGWLDDDGYLFISGRRVDVIVSAGVNTYPAEIEAALSGTPDLLDIAVVGAPDPDRGEVPVAFIVVADPTLEAEVRAQLEVLARERLARYKRPVHVYLRDALPRDGTGKLSRAALRSDLWGDTSSFAAGAPIPPSR